VLLQESGVAVLPGDVFGDDPGALRLRIATSLLYGSTDEERWKALEAAKLGSAAQLGHVVAAGKRLRVALAAL
jgi:aspartate aminotransferase